MHLLAAPARAIALLTATTSTRMCAPTAPCPDLKPQELPTMLMESLKRNDFPEVDSGLHLMWAFASDTTRFLYKGNITEYIEDAHETADTLPTSFYGVAMHGQGWEFEGDMTLTGQGGWIGTQVMKSWSSDGRLRRWQWELRRHRQSRCWFVESIGSSDRHGNFDIEG